MRYLLVLCSVLLQYFVFGQKQKPITISAKAYYGSIFIHTPIVNNVAGSNPYGAELEFSRQPIDSFSVTKCNCFPRNGIALAYFNFNNKILGKGIMLSYFIEPSYKLNKKLHFNLRGAAGLAYVSNPYDAIKNPENKNYTTHINPYLHVGMGLGYNVNKTVRALIMGNFQHFSNGAFKEPNRGLNWITGSIGVLYNPETAVLPDHPRLPANLFIDKKINVDAGILFVPQQGYNSKLMAQSKLIVGTFVQATKQFGRLSAVTGGVEVYYNKIEKQTSDETNAVVGIHGGHTFIFNRIGFSQQIGYHVYNNDHKVNKVYLRYGLMYLISDHIMGGINLKSHADNADFTDFRIMYRF